MVVYYRMNYEGFMVLHDFLKPGIQEYITKKITVELTFYHHQSTNCTLFTSPTVKYQQKFASRLL